VRAVVSLHGVAKANWDKPERENQHEIHSQQKNGHPGKRNLLVQPNFSVA
jgi:hypothetical protein